MVSNCTLSSENYNLLSAAIFLMFFYSDGMKRIYENSPLLKEYTEKFKITDQRGGNALGATVNLSTSVANQTMKGVGNTLKGTQKILGKTASGTIKGTQLGLKGYEGTANTLENAINTSFGQTALTLGVGILALQKIRKRIEKRKYIKTLTKENDAYYRCKTCSKLGYEIKQSISDIFKNSKYENDNVLYLTTDTDNRGLYIDKKYFDEHFKKEHLTSEGIQISINNLNSEGRRTYGDYVFGKMKLHDKLTKLNIIPKTPKVIMVSYTYFPISTKEVEKNCNQMNKLLQFGRNKLNKTITFNGNDYEIDAMVMSNFTKSAGDYLISGITCNSTKYIFIGSGLINNEVKIFGNDKCSLMEYDWFDKNNAFCFKNESCQINELNDLQNPDNSKLCFNKTTGSRVFMYVRK